MQTTLRIDDQLHREAKAEAAREGLSLTQFLEDAIRQRLHNRHKPATPHVIRTHSSDKPFSFTAQELKALDNQEQERIEFEKLKATGFPIENRRLG